MNHVKYISILSLTVMFSLQAGNISVDQAILKSEKLVVQMLQVLPLPQMKRIAQQIRAQAQNGLIEEDLIANIVLDVAEQNQQPQHLRNLHPDLIATDAHLAQSIQANLSNAKKQVPAQRSPVQAPAKKSSVNTQIQDDEELARALQMSLDLK